MKNNRWLILVAGCLIQTTLGGIYAWSTFVPHLMKEDNLTRGQCGFIFGLTIFTFTTAMIFAGRILTRKGPRFTALISAALFTLGYLLASLSNGAFPLLLLSIGIIAGCGIGFGYVCPLSVSMKWFPNKKGLVTGVTVAGFGAGAIILSSVAEYYMLNGVDVLTFFRYFAIVSGAILFTAAIILAEPPNTEHHTRKAPDKNNIFSTPFLISTIGIFAGTFGGLLIIGNLTPIVMKTGLTEKQAVLSVSLFAIGNGLGRIIWGKIFDHYHYKTIPLSLAAFGITALLLIIPLPYTLLMTNVILIGFCFGANFVIYASAISGYFGTQSFPRLYPICFMGYGIAGIIGPGLGGLLADKSGTYNTAIYLCIAIVSIAATLSTVKLNVFHDEQKTIRSS